MGSVVSVLEIFWQSLSNDSLSVVSVCLMWCPQAHVQLCFFPGKAIHNELLLFVLCLQAEEEARRNRLMRDMAQLRLQVIFPFCALLGGFCCFLLSSLLFAPSSFASLDLSPFSDSATAVGGVAARGQPTAAQGPVVHVSVPGAGLIVSVPAPLPAQAAGQQWLLHHHYPTHRYSTAPHAIPSLA